jgi:hypothetical protein
LRWLIANAKRLGRSNCTISISAVCGLPAKTCWERYVAPNAGGPPETGDMVSFAFSFAHSGWCSTSVVLDVREGVEDLLRRRVDVQSPVVGHRVSPPSGCLPGERRIVQHGLT